MQLISRFILVPFLLSFVFAENAPVHEFRILAVGDPPPFVQEIRDGARYEVAPPAGSVPPRELKVPALVNTIPHKNESVRIRLGCLSEAFSLPVTEPQKPLELRTATDDVWMQLNTKPGGKSLLLAWRAGRDWTKSAHLEISQDQLDRASTSVHLANVTNVPVAVIIGTERIRLEPRKNFTRTLKPGGEPLPIQILYPNSKGVLVSILESRIEPVVPGIRVFAIYMADGNKPRTPVKVTDIEEPF